jgi:hypothetical protein
MPLLIPFTISRAGRVQQIDKVIISLYDALLTWGPMGGSL